MFLTSFNNAGESAKTSPWTKKKASCFYQNDRYIYTKAAPDGVNRPSRSRTGIEVDVLDQNDRFPRENIHANNRDSLNSQQHVYTIVPAVTAI